MILSPSSATTPFLSSFPCKTLKIIVFWYLSFYHLLNLFLSGFHLHSTETAFLMTSNDLPSATQISLLLDMAAAFDKVDHIALPLLLYFI